MKNRLFNLDVHSLALFRIILGSVAFYDIFLGLKNWESLFSPWGVLTYSKISQFSLLNFFHSPWAFYCYFIMGLLFSFFIIIGFKTRIFTFFTWAIILNLQLRNPYLLNFGDNLLLLSLFWSVFLSLDEVWSVEVSPRRLSPVLNLGIIFQFLVLYLFSVHHKYGPTWREDFTAVWWALKLNFKTPLIEYLLAFPLFLKFLTIMVLITESVFATGAVFFSSKPRLKTFCVFMGIFFHLGIKLTLDHGYFPYICIGLWSLLLPSWFWQKVFKLKAPSFIKEKKNIPLTISMFFFMALVLWFNLKTTSVRLWRLTPNWVDTVGDVFKLHQAWSMYGSDPPRVTTWKIIKGNLKNKEQVNLLLPDTKYFDGRPKHYLDIYSDQKWTSLLSRIFYPHNKEIYEGIAEYFCKRTANLESLEIHHFSHENHLLREDAVIEKSNTYTVNCQNS